MIEGILPTILLGLVGGLLSEGIRLAGALRDGHPPANRYELLGSAFYVICGGFAVLYGWSARPPIEVATLGAAFPALFAAAARGGIPAPAHAAHARTFADYMASRF